MSNDILKKLKNKEELTIEEINYCLTVVIDKARGELKKVNISDEKKCVEASWFMYLNICPKFNIEYLPLQTNALDEKNLFHWFGIMTFNKASYPISFICDLTYKQFKVEPEYAGIFSEDDLNNDFSNSLINDGVVPFTQQNFDYYIDLFMTAKDVISIRQLGKELGRKPKLEEMRQLASTNKFYRREFKEYLKKELSSENLHFNSDSDFVCNKTEVPKQIKKKR